MAVLRLISAAAAELLTAYANHAPDRFRRGKVFRSLARWCDGSVVTSRYGVRMHVNRKDRTNQLCILGRYPLVPDEVKKLREGMCFIDVGANAGLFSLMASFRVGEEGLVVAFEPSVEQYRYLVRNIEANGCRNILPLQLAVSHRTGRFAFFTDDEGHTGTHHVSPDGSGDVSVIGVNVSDDFQAIKKLINGRETVVKIDVEGFEKSVIFSLQCLLRLPEVVSVIVEIDDHNLGRFGSSARDVRETMIGLGFSPAAEHAHLAHSDVVFNRPERPSAVHLSCPRRQSGRLTCAAAAAGRRTPGRRAARVARRLVVAGTVAYAALAFCAAIIDPYGIVDLAAIPGVNVEKTQRLQGGGRTERSIRLWLSDYDTLILGGSRVQLGLNPASEVLAGHDAYNAAVPAMTMEEIDAIARFAVRNERVRRVLIGLDLEMFEADRLHRSDFEASGFDGDWMPLVYARALLHPQSMFDAMQTVRDNLDGLVALNRPDGFRMAPPRGEHDYREAFTEVLSEDYIVRQWQYADFDYVPSRLGRLANALGRLSRAGIDVYVFVPPIHARQLEAIYATGVYPTYERWIRDLAAAVAAADSGSAEQGRVQLWDFSGYNTVTTEDVPDWNDLRRNMIWYRDSAHFTAAAGDLIVMRMLGRSVGGRRPPSDFGERLDPSTVEMALARKRDSRVRYLAFHPDEVFNVRRLVARAVPGVGFHVDDDKLLGSDRNG